MHDTHLDRLSTPVFIFLLILCKIFHFFDRNFKNPIDKLYPICYNECMQTIA